MSAWQGMLPVHHPLVLCFIHYVSYNPAKSLFYLAYFEAWQPQFEVVVVVVVVVGVMVVVVVVVMLVVVVVGGGGRWR